MDSNHRKRKLADLQSAPVGHLGIPPKPSKLLQSSHLQNTLPEQCFSLYPAGLRREQRTGPEFHQGGKATSHRPFKGRELAFIP